MIQSNQKGRIAEFLMSYWSEKDMFKDGKGEAHIGQLKTQQDVADFKHESRQTTQRLLKLNLSTYLNNLYDGSLGTIAA